MKARERGATGEGDLRRGDGRTALATAADWETGPAACPLCGAAEGRLLWARHGFSWLRCRRDGLVWVSPRLTEASIDEIYRRVDARKAATLGGGRGAGRKTLAPGDAALSSDATARSRGEPAPSPRTAAGRGQGNVNVRYRGVLTGLGGRLGEPGRLLELGAFDGDFLVVAESLGWRAEGTEINAAALGRARAQGLTMHEGRLSELELAAASYDAVVLRDVLEHLPEPLAELRRIRRLLRPGGMLYVWVPNLGSLTARLLGPRWGAVVFPWHLNYVDGRSLPILLAAAGFQVEHLSSANLLWRLSDPWAILHGRGAPPGPLARRLNRWAGRLLAPLFRLLDGRGVHLGAQLEAWARVAGDREGLT